VHYPDASTFNPPSRLSARVNAWSVFAAVAAGILIERHALEGMSLVPAGLRLAPILFGIAGLIAAALLLVPSRLARPLMLCAAILFGTAATMSRLAELPLNHITRLHTNADPADPPMLVRVRGMVIDTPKANAPVPGSLDAKLVRFNRDSLGFSLRVDSLIANNSVTKTQGKLRIFATALPPNDIKPGDRIEVVGMLNPPRPRLNPGEPDTIAWARQSNRAGSLATNADSIKLIQSRGQIDIARATILRMLTAMRAGASTIIDSDRPGSAIIRAMLLGERSPDGRQSAEYARTGTSHLLAISGFHLAVLIGITVGLVRLAGDYPRTEAVIGLAVIAVYVMIVPVRTPILRAALLAGVVLIAHFYARRWDRLTLLGWVAAGIIAVRPMDLSTLGFQLTVGITALLIWLADTSHPWSYDGRTRFDIGFTLKRDLGWRKRALGSARGVIVTAVLVWLVASPVILWHTGVFNPLAPVAVIFATPIATAIQIFGMAGLLISTISEPIGNLSIDAAFAAARALEWITGAMGRIPSASMSPRISIAWTIAAVAAALYLIVRARLRDPLPWLALCAVIIWFIIEAGASRGLGRGVAASVDMLAVGDGSCLLVRSGDDAVLWDAGSLKPGLGVRTIPRALRALGASHIPVAIITHANIDHYAALPDLAFAIGLERVFISAPALETMRRSEPDSAEGLFLSGLDRLGVSVGPISQGDSLAVGQSTLRVLWPPPQPPASIRARNDRSVVARLEIPTSAGTKRVLLNGDIQRAGMMALLADDEPWLPDGLLDADVIELPHHGSHHAVAETYLIAVGPSVVMQSTGRSRVGDRRWNRIKRSLGAQWGITATDGALGARIDRDGTIWVRSVRDGSFRRTGAPRR